MKFGYAICGVACAGLTLTLISAWPQDAQGKPKGPPANKAAPQAGQGAKGGAAPKKTPAAKAPPAAQAPAAQGQDAQAAAPAAAPGGMMAKAATPNEHHRILTDLKGNWTVAVKTMADPGAAQVESTGTSVFAIIMDGRFVIENFVGTTPAGTFNGMGVYGYDTMTDEYEYAWMNNMSTGMGKGTGSYDAASGELRWRGEITSPKNGGKAKTKSILKKVDPTHYDFTLFEERGDAFFKAVELVYTKA